MHFEILIEDLSGKIALDILIRKIIGPQHTFNIYPYKGIGHLSIKPQNPTNVNTDHLLNDLPKQLRAYGKSFVKDPNKVVIVVCDLDKRCLKTFRKELLSLLNTCHPKPKTRFCIAIEEGEAWLLGDISAIKKAFPKVIGNVLNSYQNDSICGTWELLADAIYAGGAKALKKKTWRARGKIKSVWAQKITPYMDVNNNKSPSFCYFRDKIRELI